MEIKGKISILISREGTEIEIRDDRACTTFCRIRLTPEQLSAALSRQAHVECEISVYSLDRVGKTHEHKTFEFEIPPSMRRDDEALQKMAQAQLTDGWICDGYFRSQGTFFNKDGKQYARCTIRRYV